MVYFVDIADRVVLPLAREDAPGLRQAQLAASQSIATHFFDSDAPALVVMPTGSGKTAVMMLCAYLLRATRVLIVSPSRAVRDQLFDEASEMRTLKLAGVLSVEQASPNAALLEQRPRDVAEWEALRALDVVVATVPTVSQHFEDVAAPPEDLFDLLLLDEAHHVPSPSWQALLTSFPRARKVLVTATPFRQDERFIKAKLVFEYSLRRAREDGVFGQVNFRPVLPGTETADESIAKSVAQQFSRDRKAGLKHLVMVRTSSRTRANELGKLYKEKTQLRLALVHGAHSRKHINKVIKQLRAFELDGVICVDMFAEGFDLPNLKIAGLHSPHKSLAVTLQFIGRFARTTGPDTGQATFFAVPSEIEGEAAELYRVGAEWDELVEIQSRKKLESEREMRKILESFETSEFFAGLDQAVSSLDLSDLRPKFHVKIFEVAGTVSLDEQFEPKGLGGPLLVKASKEQGAVVAVFRKKTRCVWSRHPEVSDIKHELFVLHHDPAARLLFICSTRRDIGTYDAIAEGVTDGQVSLLPVETINRVLLDIQEAKFFSIGMKRRLGINESYRTLSGSAADRSLQHSDGRLYDRGHCYGTGKEDGRSVTIGFSSASKVWANKQGALSDLLTWMSAIAKKPTDERTVHTGSGLDHLPMSSRMESFPLGVRWGRFNHKFYTHPFPVRLTEAAKDSVPSHQLEIEVLSATPSLIEFEVVGLDAPLTYAYRLGSGLGHFARTTGESPSCEINGEVISFDELLNEENPIFFTTTFQRLEGAQLSGRPSENSFPRNHIREVDWIAEGVDPLLEKPDTTSSRTSIFEWVVGDLSAISDILINDDGAGELADFVSLKENGDRSTRVILTHCKASRKNPVPGKRIDDLYDVVGQAVKRSQVASAAEMRTRLAHRIDNAAVAGELLKGDRALLDALLADDVVLDVEVTIVQPGVGRDLSEDQDVLLGAVDSLLRSENVRRFRVVGSVARNSGHV